MSHFSFLVAALLVATITVAQKRWDGEAGNSLWSDARNWTDNTLPTLHDDVLFDNSRRSTSYTVVLPNTTTTVRGIRINPASGQTIQVILPATNTETPGLVISSFTYGLVVEDRGVFQNSSGATSGTSLSVTDSVRINNGGRYIHNTQSGHANIVQILSSDAGTETGIFELNIPAASSTISMSGRRFGSLIMNSTGAGGSCNYTAAGNNGARIRGNLEIGAGVNLTLNMSDTIFVYRDFVQRAGTLNLGSSIRSVVLYIHEHFTQDAGAVITETGTVPQSVVLGGSIFQLVTPRGSWQNQVALVKTSTGTIVLKENISLPYRLRLLSGRIVADPGWVLNFQPGCSIEVDSLSATTSIIGRVRKEGLANSSFLFPVGDIDRQRWLRLEQATGTFTVEYFRSNPRLLGNTLQSGLHHISAIEYWTIDAASPASARVKLSFADPHSGGVTNMSALRVARQVNGTWTNAGNTSFSGSPGSNGWVSSSTAAGFSANSRSFALASAIGHENPLPTIDLKFSVQQQVHHLWFKWKVNDREYEPEYFELQSSPDGRTFSTFFTENARANLTDYQVRYQPKQVYTYYRVRMKNKNSMDWYESTPVKFNLPRITGFGIVGSNIVNSTLKLYVDALQDENILIRVSDRSGNTVIIKRQAVNTGRSYIDLDVATLQAGGYIVQLNAQTLPLRAYTFIKE